MARYLGPKLKKSRLFGEPILGNPAILKRRNFPPGQRAKRFRRNLSGYGKQLLEKQKAKYIYGLLERQFRNLFKKSAAKKGVTGDLLLQYLEGRLDNTVFRLGIAPTRAAARQLVLHRHVLVNGKKNDIPSYQLKGGDTIALTPRTQQLDFVQRSLTNTAKQTYNWLTWDAKKMVGTFVNSPDRREIPELINEKSIIELYSK